MMMVVVVVGSVEQARSQLDVSSNLSEMGSDSADYLKKNGRGGV
jgi:hypothetical protein